MPSKQEALRRILYLEKMNLLLKKRIRILNRAFFKCTCENYLNSRVHINCEVCNLCAICGIFLTEQKNTKCFK